MLTVRYENNCMLVYSFKKKKYYFTTDRNIIGDCKKIFSGNVLNDVNRELLNELIDMGLDEGVREISYLDSNNYLSAPLEYYFDFTSKCNLQCNHCYNRDNICSTTMSNEQIVKVITDMYNLGIMRLHLAGGEPTMVPDGLNTYMSTAKRFGIVSSMSSNGVNLTDEVCDIIFDNDLFSITISLEGANEEANAKVRGAGNFDKSVATLKRLVDIKRQSGSDMIICIKYSYDNNVEKKELEDFIKLGINLGVDVVKFANPERCVFHDLGFYGREYDKYYRVLNYVSELKERYGKEIYISDVANPINECGSIGLPGMKGCIGGQELIAINPDGRISPCLMNQINLGNINDYDSMYDFWNNSKELADYRKLISDYDCGDCNLHSACRGGCQVRKYVENGKIAGIDPMCPVKQYPDLQPSKHVKVRKLKEVKVLHSL